MRIGGDSDRLRLMRSDVASQQPDDAWTSRGNLEWPEHPRRRGYRIAERRPGELRETSVAIFRVSLLVRSCCPKGFWPSASVVG